MLSVSNGYKTSKKFVDSWWSIALIAVLVATVVYQRWDAVRPHGIRREPLTVGEQLPSTLQVKTVDEKSATVKWNAIAGPTLLYVFQPNCVWCARNMDSMQIVVAHAAGYRVIGLSLTSKDLPEYVRRHSFSFPIYVSSGTSLIKQLKIGGTPDTIVVSPEGKVMNVWPGAWGGKKKLEIERVFGVALPEIQKPTDSATVVAQ